MDRTPSEARGERDFRDALGVEVSKTCHSFGNNSVRIFVLYMPVVPFNAVLRRAMIGHLLGALEPEGLAGGGASYT